MNERKETAPADSVARFTERHAVQVRRAERRVFARTAMLGLLAGGQFSGEYPKLLAESAWSIADAMLATEGGGDEQR